MTFAMCGTSPGCAISPSLGTGAMYGPSVSSRIRSSGVALAASRTSSAFLNVTAPVNPKQRFGNRSKSASANHGALVKQCTCTRARGQMRRHQRQRVLLRVSRVHDDGRAQFRRERHLIDERAALGVLRGVVHAGDVVGVHDAIDGLGRVVASPYGLNDRDDVWMVADPRADEVRGG